MVHSRRILVSATLLIGCFGLTAGAAGQASQSSTDPWEGYADIHIHQMANQGFGGSIIWGAARGDPRTALGPVRRDFRRGHDVAELAGRGGLQHPLLYVEAVVDTFFHVFRHGEEGYPGFNSWPGVDRWTHQQVYKDWLFRAYQGGMRLMVMLAVNSEDEFGRGENDLGILGRIVFQKKKVAGRTGNDMESLDWQIREAYELQKEIDDQYGGPGKGWYRIVRDPEAAGQVIHQGKLAVILGTELQHLFNCDIDRPRCSEPHIVEGLDRLEAMGVNYVFPVHHKLNQFGGPAKFSPVNSGPDGPCPVEPAQYIHNCSTVGLTHTGDLLVKQLMSRGMLIDTEHLSERAFYDVMEIAGARHYPVFAGHVIPWSLGSRKEEKSQSELARRDEDLKRIFDLGGIVAPMLGTPTLAYKDGKVIPVCKWSDHGSIDQWANAYLLLRDLAPGGGLSSAGGQIAIGTDFNGFAGYPAPRASCAGEGRFRYPIHLPPLVPSVSGPLTKLPLYHFPQGRDWNFDQVGAAHVGMLPDFLAGVQRLQSDPQFLAPFYQSARGVVNLWTSVRNRKDTLTQHHLRWVPQHAFDVFDYDPNDGDRTIPVSDGGYPICRTRAGHQLGYREGTQCKLVEAALPMTSDPVQVAVYHSGRCLTVSSHRDQEKVTQFPCGVEANQFWSFRHNSNIPNDPYWQIISSATGYCLTARPRSPGHTAKIVQEACKGTGDDQRWYAKRTGNTFQLKPATLTTLCAEVKNQSRKDGAPVRQQACNGASNQLWSVETLRQDDYELLYQADLKQFDWKPAPDSIPVTVRDDVAICRASGAAWLGIVAQGQCVGKTYSGQPDTAAQYQVLYQRP